jgi:hypothetical protein
MGAGYSDRKGKREERKSFGLFPSVLRPSSLSVEGWEAHYPCTCRGRYGDHAALCQAFIFRSWWQWRYKGGHGLSLFAIQYGGVLLGTCPPLFQCRQHTPRVPAMWELFLLSSLSSRALPLAWALAEFSILAKLHRKARWSSYELQVRILRGWGYPCPSIVSSRRR